MNIDELLLNAWVMVDVGIRGNRLLNSLSMNEMLFCGAILNNDQTTASTLSNNYQMLKSQVNKVLSQLEAKNIITKMTCPTDKRKSVLALTENGKIIYEKEHQSVLKIVQSIINKLGNQKSELLTELMTEAVVILKGEK